MFLKGTLKGRLTIAADDNIELIGNVAYQGGTGGSDLLGMVANNYVEIYHPVDLVNSTSQPSTASICDGAYREYPNNSDNWYCNLRLPGATTALDNPTISGAILSVAHSFRVQNYAYGVDDPLGAITVNGAIAQKYRGIVGLIRGSSGYTKNYGYDQRLKYSVAAPVPQPRGERVADRDLGRAEAGVRLERTVARRVCACGRLVGCAVAPGRRDRVPAMSDAWLRALVALPFGLAIGSFMTVVIDRIPAEESVVSPRSRCPGCGAAIAHRDNVPVVSWVLLRGRCRNCGERISVEYPLLELSTAALVVGAAAHLERGLGRRSWWRRSWRSCPRSA